MRKPRQRGNPGRPKMIDPEWRDGNPRALLKGVERECVWDERENYFGRQGIMQKQQVVPALGHDPGRHRCRPGTMRRCEENGVSTYPPGPTVILLGIIGLSGGRGHGFYGCLSAHGPQQYSMANCTCNLLQCAVSHDRHGCFFR